MAVPDVDIRKRLQTLIKGHQERKPPAHAQLIRAKLIDEVTPVRALLKALTDLTLGGDGQSSRHGGDDVAPRTICTESATAAG